MKKIVLVLGCFMLFTACNNNDKKPENRSDNKMDAVRNFVRAALDGKFNEARTYMLADTVNTNYMDVAERSFQNLDAATKEGYRASSIYFHKTNIINDSVSVVVFSNSYKNNHDTLKVVRQNNNWLVDFKYLYLHNYDTVIHQLSPNDTLQ